MRGVRGEEPKYYRMLRRVREKGSKERVCEGESMYKVGVVSWYGGGYMLWVVELA